MRHLLLISSLFLFISTSAQNFVLDGVLFWENIEWERTDLIHCDTAPYRGAPLAIRRYYGNRHDIREEFLRIDDHNWLLNSYDTSGAFRYRRGRMMVDLSHPRIDSILTFDPETYDEIWRVDTTWLLREQGFWQETDPAGFRWEGEYVDGKRQGKWRKRRAFEEGICDCRGVTYQNGQLVTETQLNLALTSDTASVTTRLTGWGWAVFPKVRSPKLFLLIKWNGDDWPQPATGAYYAGSHLSMFYFWENSQAQGCSGIEEKTGRWTLSKNMELQFSWENGTTTIFKIRSLIDDEMILERLN